MIEIIYVPLWALLYYMTISNQASLGMWDRGPTSSKGGRQDVRAGGPNPSGGNDNCHWISRGLLLQLWLWAWGSLLGGQEGVWWSVQLLGVCDSHPRVWPLLPGSGMLLAHCLWSHIGKLQGQHHLWGTWGPSYASGGSLPHFIAPWGCPQPLKTALQSSG